MKKLLIAITAMLTLTATAQTEHVRFMGVPLDGDIQQFQAELTAKGCSHDPEASAAMPKGVMVFKGNFAGHDAQLYVFHNETTNLVYQAQAVITCKGKDACEAVFDDINSQLQEKYGTLLSTKSVQYGHDSYGYTVMSEQRVVMGDIGLFVTKDENTTDSFSVHVQYTDTANQRKHQALLE